ncbi:Aste57867_612 [Aphanomyces stellatus]|uniref:Aste57867_612 protein n=1 Tax=Aphanomyces stellatus TaxID=120398 RepID=A0A485K486_9STRA|nr:hypothetical protein As57867_000611 [Aphanomyces stellatus]VFT77837.1 Aste57867_612 [Aphanomyces stellatus]
MFVGEILIMSTFDSPCIIKFLGVAWTRPIDLVCVMEYMDGGDIRGLLAKRTVEDFPWHEKLAHIRCIVEALVYLHSFNIIHRDLKSHNILLDSTKGTKVTDFGVSKEGMEATMTMGVGIFRWIPPEVIPSQNYSTASDIYSFGVILTEFATHMIPYENVLNPKSGRPYVDMVIIQLVAAGKLKPSFEGACSDWLDELAKQCLA